MKHWMNRFPLALAVSSVALAICLQACSSGSGGSEVGNRKDIPPTARAQVLNGGETNVFREGAEVLLSGKASEDGDGPLLDWRWRQTGGPAVRLIERNSHTVSFTAPDVSAATDLTFELEVEDTGRLTGKNSIGVTVVPAQDADKFLSLDVRGATRNTFDTFKVVAALADGATTGATPQPFALSVKAYLVYPPRSDQEADCAIDMAAFAGGIPTSLAGGCLVEPLEDLTPQALAGGATGIEGEWPAGVTVSTPPGLTDAQVEALRVSEAWNPRFTLKIPRLDVDDFNQRFVDSGERHKLLDLFNAYRSRIVLSFDLTAPGNQQDATLILTNLADVPVALPASPKTFGAPLKIVVNDGIGLPTAAIVPLESVLAAIVGRESALTAAVYYQTVDPLGERDTLQRWLEQAGFLGGDGRLLPEAVAGNGEFAHAVYLNNYDLGFGRDMYSRRDEFGNVYSFVVNYSTLEGAIRRVAPIVTVVMEYSPLDLPSDPDQFVKFFTYVDDGTGDSRLVGSMNFDGRGERFTPGNCVACHGGVKPPSFSNLQYNAACGLPDSPFCYTWPDMHEGVSVANGNLHATFLPWDLESFLFADDDPAITDAPVPFDGVTLGQELLRDFGNFSRGAQESQFKKLNQFVYSTYCNAAQQTDCVTDGARALVEHWYGGVDQNGKLIDSTFSDAGAPAGWQNGEVVPDPQDSLLTLTNPDDAETLYQAVYGQHCRMCHTNMFDPTLRFDTYQKLVRNAVVPDIVFRQGLMPAARLTMDRFWAPQNGAGQPPAAILAAHLGLADDEAQGPAPRAALGPVAPVVTRNATVRLSAVDSLFAQSFSWAIAYTPPPELVGSMGVLGYAPKIVGNGTAEPAIVVEKPGTYTASVIINGADVPAPAELTASGSFSVENFVPLACDDEGATTPGGDPVTIPFLQNDRFAVAASGSTCASAGLVALLAAPDVPVSYNFPQTLDQNGRLTTASGGVFTLNVGAPCTLAAPAGCADDVLTYEPNGSGDSYVDSLMYTVTDVDGETSANGVIEVDVTANLVVVAGSVANPISESTASLSFTISGGAPPPVGEARYTVTLTTAPSRGTVRRGFTALTLGSSFQTNGAPADLAFTYVSDDFETGLESLEFTVRDSALTARTAEFDFTVLPQAPFSLVMQQWASTAGGKTDCLTACHGTGGIAVNRMNLQQSAALVHLALINGTSADGNGTPRVVPPAQRQTNPDNSLILCYPSGLPCPSTPPGAPHDIAEALPSASPSYGIIRRWIQEGAQLN